LVATSVVVTMTAVSTGTLPPAEAPSALGDFLWPAVRTGAIGNTLGGALGLGGWRAFAPLAAVALAGYVSIVGVGRSHGVAAAAVMGLESAARSGSLGRSRGGRCACRARAGGCARRAVAPPGKGGRPRGYDATRWAGAGAADGPRSSRRR